MNLLEELRHVNPNEPGSWPVVLKAGALASLLGTLMVAGYLLDWEEQWEALEQVQQEEDTLKATFIAKKNSAVNLDLFRVQLAEVEQTLGTLLKQLPNKSELDALLVDINRAGLGRGLQFELFKPNAKETVREFYAELPVSVRVTGNYHDIGAFASDVAQLPRIVTLQDIEIIPGKDRQLILNATAKTFRYLDDEEIAERKREMTEKNKQKNAKGAS
ncbi:MULTISPECIES: type 4a pilus biogenesis protein PilO [Nitrosomonas]|uniref:Type IV pilus assembly protein PilO n=2 Tax=Nitrosomonas eutropha TaxID=916 RepID=A0ABX5M3H4_9PROT|nr:MULTISPECIES: type 4a pilus biogenesis protein PilO [Nitrosomonas]ABI60039.1 Pilus assembly protein, PilO [Nitrosomonas eutropha C91]MXS79207.1 pilus assembly protein PilO [Nitrosomonas sp. GH22]PXV74331.1 type IV pilus assembly protein PilO [Nitrosomonas eutropha]SEJ30269.1 type IV pilus assembly protein PilO [Nitrosomonas eutropha]